MKRSAKVFIIGLVVVGLGIPLVVQWRSVSLERLQQCRREIPPVGSGHFESPCASMTISVPALSGVSRERLESMLGRADYCSEPYNLEHTDAMCVRPVWMFYHLQGLGGGRSWFVGRAAEKPAGLCIGNGRLNGASRGAPRSASKAIVLAGWAPDPQRSCRRVYQFWRHACELRQRLAVGLRHG
jgi:hypothetical protein